MSDPELWRTPWTQEQVEALEDWQADPLLHPYVCPNRHTEAHSLSNIQGRALTPTADGWVCPDCDYRQDWAIACKEDQPDE